MPANSATVSSDSLLQSDLSPSHAYIPYGVHYCFFNGFLSTITITFFITNSFLLLPLCIFILYLGLQQCCQQRSTSPAAVTSHSDSFTYQVVIIELVGVIGSILCCCGILRKQSNILWVGYFVYSITWYGEIIFNILTCVERYLAVVHPVTYLSLKSQRGIRIRNISIGCAWLFSFIETALQYDNHFSTFMDLCLMISSVIIISFCSLSILWVLIRPGPGEHSSDRTRADQSKRRAFYIIIVILGVLLLRTVYALSCNVIYSVTEIHDCVALLSDFWFNFPFKLVLPLLFVLRAGIFACSKKNTK